jgi:tetratricopeptide (TPR) repeat protein
LDRDEYFKFVNKRDSVVNQEESAILFGCWKAYERMKGSKSEYDIGDLALNIYQRLLKYPSQILVDYIYLDEVQDLTQIQIAIFHKLCANDNGFVFAGDTAQTISSGVGFRFEDVRRLHYQHYLNSDSSNVPTIHYLTQNYRTHSGIINFASTIVGLMFEFFPNSIDKIPAENGALYQGSKPYFLLSHEQKDLEKIIFGQEASRSKNGSVELGADQVIIVRNEETKNRLQSIVGAALILTVYESKGLEFEDVLVFNFFSDSDFSRWRLVIDSIDSYHGFDSKRDYVMCNELKALYVSCTRAKSRLWFFEETDHAQPMVDFWQKLEVLNTSKVETLSLHFAAASSAESWEDRANEFFSLKQFESAQFCFEKSKKHSMARLCKAKLLLSEAETWKAQGKVKQAEVGFINAAEVLAALNKCIESAQCYIKGKDFENAVAMFVQAQEFISALKICLLKKYSKKALQILESYGNIADEIKERFSRLFAIQEMKNISKMQAFFKWLPLSSRRKFLIRYEFYDLLLEFDLQHGSDEQIATSYLKKGNFYKSFLSYAKGKLYREALQIAFQFYIGPHWISVISSKDIFVIGKLDRPFTSDVYNKEYSLVIRRILEFEVDWELVSYSYIPFCLLHYSKYSSFVKQELVKARKLTDTKLYQLLMEQPKALAFIEKVSADVETQFSIMKDFVFIRELLRNLSSELLKPLIKAFMRLLSGTQNLISSIQNQKVSIGKPTGFALFFPVEALDDDLKMFDLAKKEKFYSEESMSKYRMFGRFADILKKFNCTTANDVCMAVNRHLDKLTICPSQLPMSYGFCKSGDTRCQWSHEIQICDAAFEFMYDMRLQWLNTLQNFKSITACKESFQIQVKFIVKSMFPYHPLQYNASIVSKGIVQKSINLAINYYLENMLNTHTLDGQIRMVLLGIYTKETIPHKVYTMPVKFLYDAYSWLASSDRDARNSFFNFGKYLFKFLDNGVNWERNDYDPRLFCDITEIWTVWAMVFQRIRSSSVLSIPASISSKLIPIEGQELPLSRSLPEYLFEKLVIGLLQSVKPKVQTESKDLKIAIVDQTQGNERLPDEVGSMFERWMTRYDMKENEIRVSLTRILKCIVTIYLNSPSELQGKIFEKLQSVEDTFKFNEIIAFKPISDVLASKSKPSTIITAMEKLFTATKDPLLSLCSNSTANAINIVEGDVLTLTNYLDYKPVKKNKTGALFKELLDTSDDAPPEVQKYEPKPWIVDQLKKYSKGRIF